LLAAFASTRITEFLQQRSPVNGLKVQSNVN
jgi:hypothetical protein